MPPEQFKGEAYGTKADVWALGCLLYELLTRKRAFQSPNLNSLSVKVMRGDYGPLPPSYSAGMHELVRSLLTISPASRPSLSQVLGLPLLRRHLSEYTNEMLGGLGEAQQLASPALATLRSQLSVCGLGSVGGSGGGGGGGAASGGGGRHHRSDSSGSEAGGPLTAAAVEDPRVEGALKRLEEERRWRQRQRRACRSLGQQQGTSSSSSSAANASGGGGVGGGASTADAHLVHYGACNPHTEDAGPRHSARASSKRDSLLGGLGGGDHRDLDLARDLEISAPPSPLLRGGGRHSSQHEGVGVGHHDAFGATHSGFGETYDGWGGNAPAADWNQSLFSLSKAALHGRRAAAPKYEVPSGYGVGGGGGSGGGGTLDGACGVGADGFADAAGDVATFDMSFAPLPAPPAHAASDVCGRERHAVHPPPSLRHTHTTWEEGGEEEAAAGMAVGCGGNGAGGSWEAIPSGGSWEEEMEVAMIGLSAKDRVLMRREMRRRLEAEQREGDLRDARQRYFQERVLADNAQRSQYLGTARVVGVR